MEAGLREVCRSVRIGKILIQRVYFLSDLFVFVDDKCFALLGRRDSATQTFLFQGMGRIWVIGCKHADRFNYSSRRTLIDDMSCCLIPCSVRTCRNERTLFVEDVISATGGSAMKAVEVLMERGVPEERIIFVNLVRPLQRFGDLAFR